MSNSVPRIAVDIGGTFTDNVVTGPSGRIAATAKTLTTHDRPADGALAGVDRVLQDAGLGLGQIGGMIHGTTLATNALIERRGARVACVLTRGFRDILEIAYERRYSQYDINLEKPDLIVPRSRCFTVPERVAADGQILTPLDEGAVAELLVQLDDCVAEAVAICLMHSYANPLHERRLAQLIGQARPSLAISISSEVSPEAREFDRLCTTVANAYIQPMIARYLADFADSFAGRGLTCPILMMTAGGGMTTLETAARLPIRLVESGPAGGAILAARLARQCRLDRALSFDMGGTTAKLCLIDDYRPQTARRFEIARAQRFIKGSGMPVRIPVIEMIEIGAGGGSIASVDRLGRLAVGPESAGSQPGPVSFGRGGTQPTVTDADVALGLIDPARFAEGRLNVDRPAAEAALTTEIGTPLGLDAHGAAEGVAEIVDEAMASAGRMHAVESGKDLSGCTMIAFGGNGPLHATRLARRAGVRRIVIPPDPGVGSAVGFLSAPVSFEIARSLYQVLDAMDLAAVNALFAALADQAAGVVQAGASGPITYTRTAFARYRGQGHEIEVPLPTGDLADTDLPALRQAFETAYAAQFSRPVPGMQIEILNWALSAAIPVDDPPPADAPDTAASTDTTSMRTIRCDVRGQDVAAQVIARSALTPGTTIQGPALIQEPQTTTFLSVGWSANVDAHGNLHLHNHTAGQV
ncbi:MAG: hydantoinase/oxoprolinase family protein [Pseudomonadota bacterium]